MNASLKALDPAHPSNAVKQPPTLRSAINAVAEAVKLLKERAS